MPYLQKYAFKKKQKTYILKQTKIKLKQWQNTFRIILNANSDKIVIVIKNLST